MLAALADLWSAKVRCLSNSSSVSACVCVYAAPESADAACQTHSAWYPAGCAAFWQDEDLSSPELRAAELRAAELRLAAAQSAFAEEAARRWRPPPAVVARMRQAVQRAYDRACGELTAKHGALVRLDRRNTYTLEHRCCASCWCGALCPPETKIGCGC